MGKPRTPWTCRTAAPKIKSPISKEMNLRKAPYMIELDYGRDAWWYPRKLLKRLRRGCVLLACMLALLGVYWAITHMAECHHLRQLQLHCIQAQPAFGVRMYEECVSGLPPSITGPRRHWEFDHTPVCVKEVPAWEKAIPQLVQDRWALPTRRADAFIGEVVTPAGLHYFVEIGVLCDIDSWSIATEGGVPPPQDPREYVCAGVGVYSVGRYWQRPCLLLREWLRMPPEGHALPPHVTVADTPAARALRASTRGRRKLSFGAGRINPLKHNEVVVPYEIDDIQGRFVFVLHSAPASVHLTIQ